MNFDFERLRAYLIAKRNFYGADTPIGHHCSNVIELWENRRGAEGEQLIQIDKNLAKQMAALEALCADATRH
jgi:hypothetical protein